MKVEGNTSEGSSPLDFDFGLSTFSNLRNPGNLWIRFLTAEVKVAGADSHVVDDRGGGHGGDEGARHRLRQRQGPDISVIREHLGQHETA